MSDWTSGYVAGIDYTHGYQPEMNPVRIRLALIHAGYAAPAFDRACELGFGQGLTINLHAAASPTAWHGTDFNPSHTANARELAAASGADISLLDEGFEEYCARPDLPEFDYIALHGIWSWVSAENRQRLVDFVRRKLRPGGVLYVSYNTLPGWTAMAPMRRLFAEHARVMTPPAVGVLGQVNGALDFADHFLAANPKFATINPSVAERLRQLRGSNRNYVAHEYFGGHWNPLLFSDVARELDEAKLNYACSAGYQEHFPALCLTHAQARFLETIPDATFRETMRDFAVNQSFRRDCWIKGARPLSALARAEALRRQRVVLLTLRSAVTFKVGTPFGEADLPEAVYGPVIDLLSDYQPRTLGEIEQATASHRLTLAQIAEVAMILANRNELAPIQDEAAIAKAKPSTDRLNAHLMDLARSGNTVGQLASPATGGGLLATRFPMLFLLARKQGKNTSEEWVQFAWQILSAQGQKLIKEGKILERADDNLAELRRQAAAFEKILLPILQACRIA